MSCDESQRAVSVVRGGLSGPNLIRAPTGRATLPPNVRDAIALVDGNVVNGTRIIHGDGSETRISGDLVQLIAHDEVVLQMYTSTPGQGFSRISGRVYIAKSYDIAGGRKTDLSVGALEVISSDASLCNRVFADGESDFNTVWSATKSPVAVDSGAYWSFQYHCYVGEGWYGNIGVVRLEAAQNQDRVCVGDPTVQPSTAWASRETALSTVRRYRGYRTRGNTGGYDSVGIGVNPNYDPTNAQSQLYTAVSYTNHDFLLAAITGNPNDASCVTPMTVSSTQTFVGNVGQNVCISAGDTCPNPANPSAGALLVNGVIHLNPTNISPPTLLTIDIGTCPLDRLKPKDVGQYSYECMVSRAGWTGETGSGSISVQVATGTSLCNWKSATSSAYASIDLTDPLAPKVLLTNVPATDETLQVDILAIGSGENCPVQ
jgi:hypothetical protein